MRTIDLESLKIFRTVVDEGGVVRAATKLNRVQSNVTTRIRQLEEHVGARLFRREGRSIRLSAEGHTLLAYANRLLRLAGLRVDCAAFVQRHRHELFANTPMVFTAVDERRLQFSSLSDNDAVVALRINYLAALENVLRVLPNTKNVTVVVGTSPIEKYWKQEIANEVAPLANRIAIRWYDDLSFEGILKHAAALPPQSAIFWELMIVDAAGVVHEGDADLPRLHAVANAPIFSYDDSYFGRELVGGPLLSVLEGGRQTAAVATRILGGEKAGDIKTPPIQFATPKFDWREMQRWGISERRLPPGSEIHFRDPSVWDQYRVQILLVCAVVLVQSALIAWLIYARRKRRRSETTA
jgi:hypothetical protein